MREGSARKRGSAKISKAKRNADAAIDVIVSEVATQIRSADLAHVEAGCQKLEAFGRTLLRGDLARALSKTIEQGKRSWVRDRCAAALARVGGTAPTSRALVRALSDPSPSIRDYACQALGNGGIKVAESALLRATTDDDDQVRFSAFEALSSLDVNLEDRLIARGLSDPSALTRLAVLLAIGMQWRNGRIKKASAVNTLRRHLIVEKDALARSEALAVLYEIQKRKGELEELLRLTKHKQGLVRWRAYDMLERIADCKNSGRILDTLQRRVAREPSVRAKRHVQDVIESVSRNRGT